VPSRPRSGRTRWLANDGAAVHPGIPHTVGLRTCGRLRDGRVRPERGREGTRPSPTELVRRGDRGAWAHDPLHRIEAGTGPAVAATHTPTRRASVSPAPGSETRSPITDHRSPITDHRSPITEAVWHVPGPPHFNCTGPRISGYGNAEMGARPRASFFHARVVDMQTLCDMTGLRSL
jgi:hypothetical protein